MSDDGELSNTTVCEACGAAVPSYDAVRYGSPLEVRALVTLGLSLEWHTQIAIDDTVWIVGFVQAAPWCKGAGRS